MAQFEPMEVDNISSDFDDKENSLQNSNVLPRTPCTEKGYEELDVSELNMKLRYSVTPAASPMSKSYTTNYKESNNFNQDDSLNMNIVNDNCSLTHSLNSTLTKCDTISKSPKLPLQVLPNQFVDMSCSRRSFDADINNCTITISECDNIDDNLLPSTTSSSSIVTPEATTPTKDIPKDDGGSPIMRGLKSVLNIFRSSQSPVPPEESLNKDNSSMTHQIDIQPPETTQVSTTHCDNSQKETNSRRNSPLKESVVFNDDLERELQWKDDTTVIFKHEKIPIHKLFFHEINMASEEKNKKMLENLNSTVENMDISCNDSTIIDKTANENENKINHTAEISYVESDSEFVDCETSYIKEDHQRPGLNQTASINEESSKNESKYDENKLENKNEPNFVAEDVIFKSDTEITDVDAIQNADVNIKKANDFINNSDFFNKLIIHNESPCELDKPFLVKDVVTDDLKLNIDPTTCIGLCTDSVNISRISLHENNKDIKNIEVQKNNLLTTLISEENHTQSKSDNSFNTSVPSTLTSQTDDLDQVLEINNKTFNDNLSDAHNNNLSKDLEQTSEVVIEDINRDQVLDNKTNNDNLPNNNSLNDLEQTNEIVVKDMDVTTPIIENEKDVNVNMILGNMDITIDTALLDHGNGLVDLQNCNISTYLANLERDEANEDNVNVTIVNNEEVIENNDAITLSSIDPSHEQKLKATSSTIDSTVNNVNNNIDSPPDILNASQIQPITIDEKNCENFGLNYLEISKNYNLQNKTDTPSDIPLPVDEDIEKYNQIDTSISNKNEVFISSHLVNEPLEIIPAIDKNILSSAANNSVIQTTSFEIPFLAKTHPVDIENKVIPLPENLHEVKAAKFSLDSVSVDIQANTEISLNNSINELGEVSLNTIDVPQITENEMVDNEIITSACNSTLEVTNEVKTSPPNSPKLVRKGYNINFDDIDDPFATKSNIRLSPPLESQYVISTPNINQKKMDQKRVPFQNRRKSQPEKRTRNVIKKSCNSSFDSALKKPKDEILSTDKNEVDKTDKLRPGTLVQTEDVENSNNYISKEPEDINILKVESSILEVIAPIEVVKHEENSHTEVIENNKIGEESITTTNSIVEKIATKNVFNLPEIDDIHFNLFSTKLKVCQTPPPADLGPVNCKPDVLNITLDIDKSIQEDKVTSRNVSIMSSSSKETDEKYNILNEINTEDEDTIEGPFFEADVLADIDKLSDDEVRTDAMQFKDFPSKNVNNENKDDGELFIDAEAYEFLLNQNKSNVVADNGRESLFLKFDPLFAKEVSSDGVLAALNVRNIRQSAQIKPTKEKMKEPTPIARTSVPSTSFISSSEDGHEETNATISKPMMVVNPAVSYLISPRKSVTPPRINRRSLTFTSPAMAVIDRLISLSANTSLLERDTSVPHPTREYNETDLALTQLRELLAEKEIHVHNLRCENKELNERLSIMESQVKTLEKESEERLKKINDLNIRLAEKTKMNKSMATVVEEYERTIASLISEMDLEKRRNLEERTKLITERDEQTAHLTSMEVSFSDLHSKYEKSKQIILSMKVNEDKYKKSISEFEENLLKMQNNYELLKQHATSKLNHANQELEKFNRTHEAEVLKLNAMIKRKELHITSLEESLSQKTKANEELTAICDELINKVG